MEKERYVFPERWCIRQDAHQDVCDWFQKRDPRRHPVLNGTFTYLCNVPNPNLESIFSETIPEGYVKINLEQFRLYVLGDPQYALDLKEAVREDLSYLANMFQELNIS